MNSDLTQLSLTEVAAAIASRKTSSVEVTRACLDRIDQWQPSRNCFIRIDREAALADAAECDRHLASGNHPIGPLHGVPLAHKDIFYRASQISTAGSEIRRDWVATETATVLSRLDAAGAIQIGTLNMSEFAAGPTGHNMHYGNCANAYHRDYMAGGSSSGSGSAVGARLIYGSLGSDTGGSVRLPAAANGVLGLKPTYGRVSLHGALARAWSLDHVGLLTRTAADCARMLTVIAGPDPNDSTASKRPVPDYSASLTRSIKGVRIGVPDPAALGAIDDQVAAALEASLTVLQQLGAIVVQVPFADMSRLFRVAETIIKCEGASMHRPWLVKHAKDYTPLVRSRIEAGLLIPATQYIDALRLRKHLTAEFMDTTLAGVDVLHMPVMPFPVPTIAESEVEDTGDAVRKLIARITTLTRPMNLLGLPALSVPCGFCDRGLPIGFQLVGHPFQEGTLLGIAHAFQQVTDYHLQQPVMQLT